MRCQQCGKSLKGEITVKEDEAAGCTVILLEASPDRDWIACDACNALLCHECCTRPETGYCDDCIKRYNLDLPEDLML